MRIFSYEELDELGEGLIRQYLGKEAERTCCVDIEGFVTDFLKLPLLYRSFAEEDSDKIGFIADGSTPLCVYENGEIKNRIYPRGTIVIERCLRREHESGRRRFTISHECAHYIMDRAVPSAAFHREFDNERIYSQEDFKNLFSFRETQVDRMGAALLMPRFMVRNAAAMLEDVKARRTNCIIVKDLSRFGRNYLDAGEYIEKIFPFLGVRFISVNDGFDSSNPLDIDSLDTSFRTLIYDLYSRDLSRRVKSAKKARAERGAFLSPYAPYGYVKDPEDKNHLLVDEEAAVVIRRIFQRAADGLKAWEIAAELNGDGICSPKTYKVNAGYTRTPWRSIQEENFWTVGLITKILRDERYIGKVVYRKRIRDIVESPHTVKISRDDWIVVPDRHEAIVLEALFEKAQICMREYRVTGSGNPLKRKVICGVCGHAMQRDNKKNGSYRCVMKRLNTGFDCSEDRIPEPDILEAVIDTIQVYAQYAVSIDRLLQTRQEQRQLDRKQAQRQLQTLQSRKVRLDKRLQDLYEGLVEGGISRESFAAQKKALTAQAEEISRTVLELEHKISGSDDGSNAVIEHFKSYAGITALTREISIDLLQSVTIYPDGRMDIRLNPVDEIKALMETLRRESCTA